MSAIGFQLSCLRDPRLAPLATSARPAWLWSTDASRVLWANPVGAAMLGAPDPGAIGARNSAEPAAAQIARIAATLPPGAPPRLERLRGFGAGIGRALTCACSHVVLADATAAILVAAVERAGPDLSLEERAAGLVARCEEPVAAFAADGRLLAASAPAHAHLSGATSLAAFGAQALAAAALANGRAAGPSVRGPVALDRIGGEAATMLLASFEAPAAAAESAPEGSTAAAPQAPAAAPVPEAAAMGAAVSACRSQPPRSPELPTERRHPLRFVWQMDEAGRFTLESEEFIALMGSRPAAALGRPWSELAAGLGLDPDGQIARAVASRDTWSGLAVRWPVDDGTERLAVELSGLPVFDRERTYRGYRGFGVCRDLERLAALAGRRQSAPDCPADVAPHAASASVAQPAPDHAPPAAAAGTENIAPSAATAAEPNVPALSPIERSAFRELSRKLSQRLTAAGIEHESTAPAAGEDDPPEIASEGEPAHALVTDAGAKLALAQAEIAELGSILDTATDGVILLDPQGSIVSANRSAEALFGYEELAGRPLADLLAPESAELARNDLAGLGRDDVASLLNSGRELTGRVRQGGLIPLFMTVGRIRDRTDKLCAVFRDMTPWKKVEQELVEARRSAERASSAKSDFLARISHEIRTPLNAIIGFSEVMMEQRFGPIGNERYRDYLKDIHASGGHLLSLINDLLDLSKIEAGKLELTFAGVALNDLVQQCVAIMQPQANRERIIIRTSLPAGLPQVVADARSVRQIVLNLLSNSIKFTGAGGQVIVSTALDDDGEVILRVRDTGVGMSEKDIVTALEPFRQLATSPRGGSGGTGLGLPLTKALAEANRASFHIKSAPEEGTLVEIAFPPGHVLAG